MNLISKAEFSRRIKKTPARVSQLSRDGAITIVDGKVDLNGEETRAYEGLTTFEIQQNPPKRPPITGTTTKRNIDSSQSNNENGKQTTIKEAQEHSKTRKMIADASLAELKLLEKKGEVISREFVSQHIFGPMDGAFRRMLEDSPVTIAARMKEAVNAGEDQETLQSIVRDQLTQMIRGMKEQMKKALKNAK